MRTQNSNIRLYKAAACVLLLTGAVSALLATTVLAQNVPPPAPQGVPPAQPGLPAPNQPVANAALPEVTIASPAAKPIQAAPQPLHSLFFNDNEVAAINNALTIYSGHGGTPIANNEGQDFLSQLQASRTETRVEKYFTYPQFYLESLAYHAPDDWIVWISNMKLTQSSKKSGDISILAIDKDKVTVEWKPVNMQKVMAVWDVSPTSDIVVDSHRGTVTFSLKHNQTFSSYVMRVLEGKVKPVVVENKPEAPVPAPMQGAADNNTMIKANESKPEQAKPETEKEKGDAGLGGLIGAYKNLGGNP